MLVIVVIALLINPSYSWYTNEKSNNLVKISIYYETMCDDSARFITNEFYPAYKTIKPFSNIEFIPYGKASHKKIHNSWLFKCQHGPLECWGNKAQACALNENINQDAKVEFIYCLMNNGPSVNNIYNCTQEAGISYLNIKKCLDSEKSDELLAKYGDITTERLPPLQHVPLIVINDEYNPAVDEKARRNFLKTILERIHNSNRMEPNDETEQQRFSLEQYEPETEKLYETPLYYQIYNRIYQILYRPGIAGEVNTLIIV